MSQTVYIAPPGSGDADGTSWWTAYAAKAAQNLTPAALSVLKADCRYIATHGVLVDQSLGGDLWPDSRVRTGIVMGSVQSGKTASMLGVTALALDAGVDAVVVLGGTQVSLWKQTFWRLADQLEPPRSDAPGEVQRVLVPSPEQMASGTPGVSPSDRYALSSMVTRRAVATGQPLLGVVMKNAHHLRAMTQTLRDRVYPAIQRANRSFHLLVLDDEADDGSILDALAEQGLNPALDDLKQVPRAIADLWDTQPRTGDSFIPQLFVTYVGYTATPQANLLQEDYNPLAPRDFVVALRTPYLDGDAEPRSTTFREPDGLRKFYTGGDAFYVKGSSADICEPVSQDSHEDLQRAVRAFLVAGAIRHLRRPDRLGPASAQSRSFESKDFAHSRSPEPHSMLIHPSALISDHFAVRDQLLSSFGPGEASDDDAASFSERLMSDLDTAEAEWSLWTEAYARSATDVSQAFGLLQQRMVPTWDQVRTALIEEIIPAVRVSVVNSDASADERPQYQVDQDANGWHAPVDLCTIFVSGNVMSRGITLEGLCTTLFLRHAGQPVADTQMQMQRWFGYRGAYLDLCRVFVPPDQLELFRAYHNVDEALRAQVITAMNEGPGLAPTPLVLQGPAFTSTGKIANLSAVPLLPSARTLITRINDGHEPDENSEVLRRTFADASFETVVVDGTPAGRPRGTLLTDPLSMLEAAALLDSLRYDGYTPGDANWQGNRWRSIEEQIGLADGPEFPLYRPAHPDANTSPSAIRVADCPYSLAAYLRLWNASLTRNAPGLVASDRPGVPWSMVMNAKSAQAPRFRIGIRDGSLPQVANGPLSELPFAVRPMAREVDHGEIKRVWGSMLPTAGPHQYRGDPWFDYYRQGGHPTPGVVRASPWRPVGDDGLILFHVIHQEGRFPVVTAGVCMPIGGPNQFASFVARA